MTRASIIVSFAVLILSSVVIFSDLGRDFSLYASGLLLALLLPVFTLFLFALSSNADGRNVLATIFLLFSHISAIIVLFANMYWWLDVKDSVKDAILAINSSDPQGKREFADLIYYSVVTWTTLGYGDIVPMPNARLVVAAEAIAGYIVMGLLIAALLVLIQKNR